jgi:hypothetical protein
MVKPITAGKISNVFTEQELDSCVKVMSRLPDTKILGNSCHGIDENNMFNNWFHKNIFNRIQLMFGNDIKLMFGMFLNESKPWGIHTDAYHVKNFPTRDSAISFLLPYSVDHQKSLVDRSRTIVFNQRGYYNDDTMSLPSLIDQPGCALDIHQLHLSHNSTDKAERMTVLGMFQWEISSLIYWDSLLYHDTDNFLANGYTNKQAIVIHTYRDIG